MQELADSLGIELLYLPSYSPNLNLSERLWKFVKKKCLYSKYYPEFSLFKTAITNCIEEAQGKHKKELDSLLTLRFQTFNKAQIMTVWSINGFYQHITASFFLRLPCLVKPLIYLILDLFSLHLSIAIAKLEARDRYLISHLKLYQKIYN